MIDDRSITGNPFDESKWKVARRRGRWVVLDALGNVIHEAPTKGEAIRWKDQAILARAGVTPEAVAKTRDEQLRGGRPFTAGERQALHRLMGTVKTGPFNFRTPKKSPRRKKK